MVEDRGQMSEDRCQRTEGRCQMSEDGGQRADGRGRRTEGRWQRTGVIEFGLRPLRAVGSRYEPEAIGAYAYAPAGMRKIKAAGGTADGWMNRMIRFANGMVGMKGQKSEAG